VRRLPLRRLKNRYAKKRLYSSAWQIYSYPMSREVQVKPSKRSLRELKTRFYVVVQLQSFLRVGLIYSRKCGLHKVGGSYVSHSTWIIMNYS